MAIGTLRRPVFEDEPLILLRTMLWKVYWTLPKSIRPGLNTLRRFMVQACLNDAERVVRHSSVVGRLKAGWYRLLTIGLAPGRLGEFVRRRRRGEELGVRKREMLKSGKSEMLK